MLATAAWAAVPIATIGVPAAGEHFYWFAYTDIKGKATTTTPKSFKDKKVTADVPLVKDAVPKGTLLYVLDAKTGNEAVKPLEGKGALAVNLKKSDFNKVRKVVVWVIGTVTDRPIAAAIVKLVDADKKAQQRVLDPSSVGSVEFNDVAEGTANVTVLYGDNKKSIQDVDISLERESPVLKIDIPIAGEVETCTISGGAQSDFDKSEQSDGEGPEARGVDYITGLIGAILLIVVVYFAVRMMRDKGAGAKSILKKLGVQVQEDQPLIEPATPDLIRGDPTICQFCGQKKDASGACSCSVIGAAAPAVSASSGPRLVAIQGPRMGEVYDLQGTLTIGREESNAVALPDDSTVSRRHARVSSDSGQFTIYDEGSSNGTFVNGVKVTEQVLRSGDEIQIGTTRLRFEA
jgi:hypothetical protein